MSKTLMRNSQLVYFLGDRMDENINVNSCASVHNSLQSSFLSGFALAIILNQKFDSLDSFLQIAILCLKSFLDSAPSVFTP
jgi:hypothetical protein